MPLIIASFSGLYGYGRIFDTGTLVSTVKGSQYLNGETSYMLVTNTDNFRMSTMDFTVEWFQNIQYLNSLPRLFSIGNFPNPSFSVSFSTFISSTTDITFPTDPIFVWPSTSSTLTAASDIIDGLSTTSYKNIVKYGAGYIIRPLAGASIVTQLVFTTAGNLPECDPITFTLEGTNDAISLQSLGGTGASGFGAPITSYIPITDLNTVSWTTIAANQLTNCSPTRYSKSFSPVLTNTTVYNAYRVRFPTIRDGATATIVQIGEVEMLGSIVNNFANVWMNSSIVMNMMTSSIFYDTWTHFALSRSTNTVRLFQNGFQIGSTLTSTINLTDSTNPLLIGTTFDASNLVVPILSQLTPISILGAIIQMRGVIDSTGGVAPTVRGFVWATSPNPTIALPTTVQDIGIFQSGSFSATVSSLMPFTTYYIRVFATNTVGTGYSNQVVFTTDRSVPIISSIFAASNTNNSSLIIAQIIATGGYDVTIRGIAWDSNIDPTISLSTTRSEIGVFSQPGFFSTYAIGLSSQGTFYTRPFATNILGISYGSNLSIIGGLYPFTSFTFTNATQQGAQGPTLSTCQSAYSLTSWTQNSSFFNITTRGIQEWTVPQSGPYAIELSGAAGGFRTSVSGTARPGYGYRISATVSLARGQVVRIAVGQRGVGTTSSSVSGSQAAGGGGASCVFVGSTLLMIAAGGNGQSWEGHTVPDPDGRGTGQTVILTGQGRGFRGATFSVNGDGSAAAALSILNGAVGGNANDSYAATGAYSVGGGFLFGGGFGGGGGTNPFEGGGGGGFQGGIPKGVNDYSGTYLNQGAVSFVDSSLSSPTNIGTNISGTTSDTTNLHGYCIVNLLVPAVLSTSDATSITGTTAISGGNVTGLGSSPTLILRGVVWSTLPSPTIALLTKVEQSGSFSIGSYSLTLMGLLGGTTYYIRAYVSGTGGLTYGDEKQFITAQTAPTVTTNSATLISGGSTTVTCTINSTGGATVTTRGICWDTSPNPTIALATKTVESGSFSTGTFTSTATGISANTVYIRAYATNSLGTSYGGGITAISTPAWVDSTLLFFLPFNGDASAPASYTDAGPNRNNFPRLGGSLITIGGRIGYNGTGQGGNVLLLNLAINSVTNATYSCWVYLLTAPSDTRGVIFSRSNSNSGVCGINFNGSSLHHHWNDNYYGQSSAVVPPLRTWTYIAVVITPTASFWYQNGTLVETKSQNYPLANLSNVYIGNDNPAVASGRDFNGYIDDPMFARRAYSSSEIATIYTNSITDHTGLPF